MSCSAPTIVVGGATLSTNPFENAQEILKETGSTQEDPTHDEYEGNIATGNNTSGATGVAQIPAPVQTTPPPEPTVPPVQSNDKPPPALSGADVTCTIWDGTDYDVPMSTNFILRNFTVGYSNKALNMTKGCLYPHPLIDIPFATAQTRFCNLQALSLRVLEPLYAKFGSTMRINSAIRNEDTVKAPNRSQHMTGEAADIQWPGWNYQQYWDAAQWVKDNIPYDQFIFEHSASTGSAWFHLSYNQAGGRAPTDNTKVMTMYQNSYKSGLQRYN